MPEVRCPVCKGTGKIGKDNNICPRCRGKGYVWKAPGEPLG